MVSSPFPKPVLQGAQAWLLAETPHLPSISRNRVCSLPRQVWAKSLAPGQVRPPRAGPQSGLGQPVGPGRLAHLGGRPTLLVPPSPFPAQPPPRRGQLGLPESVRARVQAGAKCRPEAWPTPGHRPPRPCCGKEGGSAGRSRPGGGGFCPAKPSPPRLGGREGRTARGLGPGMERCETGPQADTGPTGRRWRRRHWNYLVSPPPGPRPPETEGTLTWLGWAARTSRSPCACRCGPVRAAAAAVAAAGACPSLLPAAPPAGRPAAQLLGSSPCPLGPTPCAPAAQLGCPGRRPRLAPPSRVTGQAGGRWSPPACGEAGPQRTPGR